MNQYKAQYESYYAKVKEKSPNLNYARPTTSTYSWENGATYRGNSIHSLNKKSNMTIGIRIGKRIIIQLVGSLLLFAVVLLCKAVNTPEAMQIYNLGKEVIDKEISLEDIKSIDINGFTLEKMNFEEFDMNSIQNNIEDFFNNIKENADAGETLMNETYKDYMKPLEGMPMEYDKTTNSLFIKSSEEEVVVSSSAGFVKTVKNSEDIGEYVCIDCGDGVEITYGNLSDINVVEGDKLSKGDRIGKTSMNKDMKEQGIILKLMYMGNYKNPSEYINLEGNNI